MGKIGSGIIIQNKRVLLIKRSYTKKDNPDFWAFPGGNNENNETMKETTIRELKEEIGIEFSELKLFLENKNEKHHFFRYIGKGEGNIILQKDECDGYGWFTYKEAKNMPISKNMLDLINKLKLKKLI